MDAKIRKRVIKWFWILLIVPIGLLFIYILCVGIFAKIPSFEELENPKSNLATELISEDGVIFNTFHLENRLYVDYAELSPYLVEAAIATEDARFYKHSGIDFRSLARVAVKTVLMGDLGSGGGSTITQQLAKTLYPRDTTANSFSGARYFKLATMKFKEWITAVKLERNYSKDEIMSMYMNVVFFGSDAYGIKVAANTFFNKEPVDLNVQESATLVGMLNKPTRYNPARNPEESMKRRNHVLNQMQKYQFMTKAECDSLKVEPIVLDYNRLGHNTGIGSYYRDMLRRVMKAEMPKRSSYRNYDDYRVDSLQWANDPLYGWLNKNFKPDGSKYNLDKDGLKIYTTVNSKMQRYAEEAVTEHLKQDLQPAFSKEMRSKPNRPFALDVPQKLTDNLMKQARRWSDRYRNMTNNGASDKEIDASFDVKRDMRVFSWNNQGYIDTVMTPNDSIKYYKSMLRVGFMAMEPHTGNVKAYVGGPNYRYFQYDNARQARRQVGSTFKPLLYTLAMQEGFTPCDKILNVPVTFHIGDTTWTPRTTDRDEWIGMSVTLKWALTKSSNYPAAYLMYRFGPRAVVDISRKLGINGYLPEAPSLCLGSADITLYDMVAAYNTYPSRGINIEPQLVYRIEDNDGNVLSNFSARKAEAISETTAYLMINLMEGVVNDGTANRLRWKYNIEGPLAGKTGTSNDQSDGWFIGFIPKLTAGVWVGAEDMQVHFEMLSQGGGSNMALPIWGLFMQKVLKDKTLGISSHDLFVPPLGFDISLNCDGSDLDGTTQSENSNNNSYFGF